MGWRTTIIRSYQRMFEATRSNSPGVATDSPEQIPPPRPPTLPTPAALLSTSKCKPHRAFIDTQLCLGRNATATRAAVPFASGNELPMALITQTVLGKAAIAVNGMDQTQRVQLADEVFAHQPNLLASVLVLQRMGANLQQMDVPVRILLVAYQAMKTSGHVWQAISEDTQEVCLRRLTGRVQFAEGLPAELQQRSTQQYINEHREQYLLAFAWGHLRDNDLLGARTDAEKFLLLATLNLVECIAFEGAQAWPTLHR